MTSIKIVQPFISVIIPTYNRCALLKNTLQSLCKQTYPLFEIIVVDDGGADNTEEMIATLADDRINYYWKENAERAAARNYGATKAKGTWLNFFDSDDLAYPHHLATAATYITQNSTTAFLHTGYDVRDNNSVIAIHNKMVGEINNLVIDRNPLQVSSTFIDKTTFDAVRFVEDRSLAGSEDWMLWLQLSSRCSMVSINTVTSSLVQHSNRSMVTAKGKDVLRRTDALLFHISNDKVFCTKFPKAINGIASEMYSLTALHFSLEGDRKQSIVYIWKAIVKYPIFLLRRRFLAIVKHLLTNINTSVSNT
jgi:glycosyltransferase involved in cell wall biosynthesis